MLFIYVLIYFKFPLHSFAIYLHSTDVRISFLPSISFLFNLGLHYFYSLFPSLVLNLRVCHFHISVFLFSVLIHLTWTISALSPCSCFLCSIHHNVNNESFAFLLLRTLKSIESPELHFLEMLVSIPTSFTHYETFYKAILQTPCPSSYILNTTDVSQSSSLPSYNIC